MINTPVVFTSNYRFPESNEQLDSNEILFSFIFDDPMCFKKLTPEIIHHFRLTQEQNYYFCIYFDFSKPVGALKEEVIHFKEIMLHYFFHPRYKVVQNKPLICLNSMDSNQEGVKKVLMALEDYVILQGYKGLAIIYFSDTDIQQNNNMNFYAMDSAEAIASAYALLLKKDYYCSKYIGVNYKNAGIIIPMLLSIERKLLIENPSHYLQLKEHQELKEKVAQLQDEIERTEKELSDQKEYLRIFKSLDESNKIMKFYRNEYEILPLWYKKIGHIIKVLTGKRTFRSLFDNNVKKYKD